MAARSVFGRFGKDGAKTRLNTNTLIHTPTHTCTHAHARPRTSTDTDAQRRAQTHADARADSRTPRFEKVWAVFVSNSCTDMLVTHYLVSLAESRDWLEQQESHSCINAVAI